MKRYFFWPQNEKLEGTCGEIDLENSDFERVWRGEDIFKKGHVISRFFSFWGEAVSFCLDSLSDFYSGEQFKIEPVIYTDFLRLRLNLITGRQLINDFPKQSYRHEPYLKFLETEYCYAQDFLDSID